MRSYIHLQPGERLSCVGCHEPRNTAPLAGPVGLPLAVRREPSAIEPPPFGAGAFSYVRLVQPVLDRRCGNCHAADSPAGGLDLSSRRDARGVPASFATLVRPRTAPPRPPLVHFFDNWWGESWTVPAAQPLRFGAAVSRLVEVIDSQHGGVNLSGCAGALGWLGLSLRSPSEVDHGLAVPLGLRRLSPSHPDVPALQIPIGSS
jgi:hypothetical protein